MKSYKLKLITLTAILLAISLVTTQYIYSISVSYIYYLQFIYFIIIGTVADSIQKKLSKQRNAIFINGFMGLLTGKMFLSLAVAVIIALLDRSMVKFHLIHFMILYFSYTSLLVIEMLKTNRESQVEKTNK